MKTRANLKKNKDLKKESLIYGCNNSSHIIVVDLADTSIKQEKKSPINYTFKSRVPLNHVRFKYSLLVFLPSVLPLQSAQPCRTLLRVGDRIHLPKFVGIPKIIVSNYSGWPVKICNFCYLYCFLKGNQFTGVTSEYFSNLERLRQETLDLTST